MIPFAAYTAVDTLNAFQWAAPPPESVSSRGGISSHLIYSSLVHLSLPSNQHLDRFSRLCRVYKHDQQTHRQTDTKQTTLLRL